MYLFTFYNIYIKTAAVAIAAAVNVAFTFYNIYIKTILDTYISEIIDKFTFYNIYIKTYKIKKIKRGVLKIYILQYLY